MAEWYYARNNQRLGPVTLEQLKQLAASGQLSANDLVWKEGMANWAAASTIPGIFGAPAAPAAPPARSPAVASSGVSGTLPDEVVALPLGSSGPSLVDTAMLIAKRAVEPDLEALKVADEEKAELSKAGFAGETTQRYLVWRRSMLWVALVPLAFTGISLVIDSAVYSFENLNGFGVLMEVLRILTLLGLPAAGGDTAPWTWSKPQTSPQMRRDLGLPRLLWSADHLPTHSARMDLQGRVEQQPIRGTLRSLCQAWAWNSLAVIDGVDYQPHEHSSGSGARSTAYPDSASGSGCHRIAGRFFALDVRGCSSFGMSAWVTHFVTPVRGVIFTLCMTLAPVCYLVGSATFLRPIASPGDRGKVAAFWQWIYYGLSARWRISYRGYPDALITEEKLGAYGVWIAVLLFLDFIGRSLFVTVVGAQFVLSLSRSALIAQQQIAKTDQGRALDRRLSELEPLIGKL